MPEENAAKLEEVIRQHMELRMQLEEVKRIAQGADENAEKAHRRINSIERRLDKIDDTLIEIKTSVHAHGQHLKSFDKKQDIFMANTWQLVKYLLILLAAIVTILGGLVGVKISFPWN
jgi:chromosome segregation ATPase